MPAKTLHYEDGRAEIHKIVVGPMDNYCSCSDARSRATGS